MKNFDRITYSEINLKEKCIYKISNLESFLYGINFDDNFNEKKEQQTIIINLKDNTVTITEGLSNVLYRKEEFNIVEIFHTEESSRLILIPNDFTEEMIEVTGIDFTISSVGIELCFIDGNIIFTLLSINKWAFFKSDSNWIIERS